MKFENQLGTRYPIIQAPMAGVTTPAFVASSIEAGILGSIGAGYLSANETREFIHNVKSLTTGPFSVNLFISDDTPFDQNQTRQAYQALRPIGEQIGMPFWKVPLSVPDFAGQVDVLLEEKPAACSFTFGIPSREIVQRMHEVGILLIGTATTLDEAKAVEQAGLDMVVLQGLEAGGHRGSFTPTGPLVTLDELLRQAHESIQIPLIATGGIATHERMTELVGNGAQAIQIGTLLLAVEESGASSAHKEAVLKATEDCTVLTDVFSGRPARSIRNQFIQQMAHQPIASYPYQNDLTKGLRKEAARQHNADFLSLWAGSAVGHVQPSTIEEIVAMLIGRT